MRKVIRNLGMDIQFNPSFIELRIPEKVNSADSKEQKGPSMTYLGAFSDENTLSWVMQEANVSDRIMNLTPSESS